MAPKKRFAERFAERAVLGRLAQLREGALLVREGAQCTRLGSATSGSGDAIELRVLDARFWRALAFGGHVGAGEAYAAGWWECDELAALVRLFVRNREALDALERGPARWSGALRRAFALLRPNTRAGSRRHIRAHYDLGNDFFAALLDETMTYSCGWFEHPGASLREAAEAKYERLCALADLRPGQHVLEIGTGWGGFALHAARHHGCRVTTTTISREQHRYARARFAQAGLDQRITLLERDYRELEGRFDRIVSIEMIEAIGHAQLPLFFERCAQLLAPDGRMALQTVTIEDRHYERARREVDFIRAHVFPGSVIPSLTALSRAASRTDLRIVHAEDIGLHYAETLRRWRANLRSQWQPLLRAGYGEALLRTWEFYFAYCEGGFDAGALGDLQLGYARSATLASAAPLFSREPRVQLAPAAFAQPARAEALAARELALQGAGSARP